MCSAQLPQQLVTSRQKLLLQFCSYSNFSQCWVSPKVVSLLRGIISIISCITSPKHYKSTVNSSIFGKSSHFPFPYFVLFVLQYFPFHVVYIYICNKGKKSENSYQKRDHGGQAHGNKIKVFRWTWPSFSIRRE